MTGVCSDTLEEVYPLLKEGEDLNECSDDNDDNQPKYNWDDQEYKMKLICFINEEPIIDTQMQVTAGTINNTVMLGQPKQLVGVTQADDGDIQSEFIDEQLAK